LKKILTDKGKSSNEKSTIVYSVAKNLTQDLLNNTKSGAKVERVTDWVDTTVDYIFESDTIDIEKYINNCTKDYDKIISDFFEEEKKEEEKAE